MKAIKTKVNEIFSKLPRSAAASAIKRDLLQDCKEKFYLTKEQGSTPEQAEQAVIEALPDRDQIAVSIAAHVRSSRKGMIGIYAFAVLVCLLLAKWFVPWINVDKATEAAHIILMPLIYVCGTLLLMNLIYLIPAVRLRIRNDYIRMALYVLAIIFCLIYFYFALTVLVTIIPNFISKHPEGFVNGVLKLSFVPFVLAGLAIHYGKEA